MVNQFSFNLDQNYISHHGILGQKWGKKNGPPYPLSSNQHSMAEKASMIVSKKKKILARGTVNSNHFTITKLPCAMRMLISLLRKNQMLHCDLH